MGFSQDAGYIPSDISTILLDVMANINTQFGTSYTADTFVGTNFYKYFYAIAQRMQENEVKTSEIFASLTQYFAITNERISRPVVTNPGLIEIMATNGYIASVKDMVIADAGKINICVNVDDGVHASGLVTITSYANLVVTSGDTVHVGATTFTAQSGAATPGAGTFQAATNNAATATSLAAQINAHATAGALVFAQAFGSLVKIAAIHGGTAGNAIVLTYTDTHSEIGATVSGSGTLAGGTANAAYAASLLALCTIIKDSTVAGCITQGTETTTIVLSNGQSFDFSYHLPNKIALLLRLTTVLSTNNEVVILSVDAQKALLMANIAARYSLGKNFEPQRYFGLVDAPWASSVLLEYSTDNGTTYVSSVYAANYNDLFTIQLSDVSLVED